MSASTSAAPPPPREPNSAASRAEAPSLSHSSIPQSDVTLPTDTSAPSIAAASSQTPSAPATAEGASSSSSATAATTTTASTPSTTSSSAHPATVSDPTTEDVDMAGPILSHPTTNPISGIVADPLKPSASLPADLAAFGTMLPGQAQPFGFNVLSRVAPASQAYGAPSGSPQPFQAAKISTVSPSPAVKPTDVTSTLSPAATNAASSTSSAAETLSAQSSSSPSSKMAPVVAGVGTMPPNVTAASGSDNLRAIPTNKNNPAFLNKLRSMVDDSNTDELIRWSPDGASFFVPNHVRFGDEVLPRFFKHNRFSSFVRQLNMYGFHKVPHLQQGALKHDSPQESELWEFSNPHFHRDHPDWLSKVQRKKGPRDDKDPQGEREGSISTGQELMHAGALMRTDFGANNVSVDANGDGALQLASVLNAINAIKNAQTSISADLRHLQNSNQNLWQEAVESRQRAKRQQETINKILRFLAGVFGNQDDAETPVQGKKVSGKGRGGGKRVGVRPQQQQRSKSRLMIEDGTGSSSSAGVRGLEGLELPVDDEEIEEMPSHLRFEDANNGDSPKGQSPSASNGGSRFTHIGSPPTTTSAADFGRHLNEAASTPGGSRRLSSQASNQVLNALASGEGNAWLASLFGASLANQGSKSTGPATGGGLKLDPQMVTALQQALASAGGGANGPSDSSADYFSGPTHTQADDVTSRFSAFPSNSGGSNESGNFARQNANNGLGLDADALARIAGLSQALVQSPARQSFANVPSNHSNNYTVTSPSKSQGSASLFDSSSNDASNNQQLALSLSRAARDLQTTSGDVDQLQNSINSLIEGLQTNPNLLQSIAGQVQGANSGGAAPWQSAVTDNALPFDASTTFGDISSSTAAGASVGDAQFGGPTGTTPPSTNAGAAAGAAGSMDSDFDVDSFLSQFVDTSQAPGGGVTSPSANNAFGESPSFAFSPATTAAFLHGAGVNDAPGIYAQEVGSGTNSGNSSNSTNSPLENNGPWNNPGGGRKRKPSTSGVSPNGSMDVETASSRPVKKSASRKKQ